jgi:hypothetical protein
MEVYPPIADSHFEHVNLLGMDFIANWGAKVSLDMQKRTATMILDLN